jgi:hypothetical protein
MIIFVVFISFPSRKISLHFHYHNFPPSCKYRSSLSLRLLEVDEVRNAISPSSLNVPRDLAKRLWFERVLQEVRLKKIGFPLLDQLITVERTETEKVKEIHHALAEKGW